MFDILKTAPWPIFDCDTCIKHGWVSLGKAVNMLDSNHKVMSKEYILQEYQDVFTGLGCLEGEYHIDIDPSITPVQHTPRRVPVALRKSLQEKIDSMVEHHIIAKVTTPTDWISSLVTVRKPNKLRVCIDPRDLNKAIKRPKCQMPTIDEVLPKLSKAKVFTVLDAKDFSRLSWTTVAHT
jgi:hypothetical protein